MPKLTIKYTCGDLNCSWFNLVFLIIIRIDNCDQFGYKDVLYGLNSPKFHRICLLLDLHDVTIDLAQTLTQGGIELILNTVIIFICNFSSNQCPFVTLVSNEIPWMA